jgi:peptidylprolyl isomerase
MMRKRRAGRLWPGFAVLLALAVPPAVAATSEPAPDTVARLGSTDIPAATLRAFVRTLDPATRKQALADPTVMSRLVRQELARIAILNEAAAKKWDQRPDVAARIADARDAVIVSTYLASAGAVPDGFPSDAELQAAYEANRDKFLAPRQYRLEQIFVAIPAGGDKKAEDAAKARADDLARRSRAKGVDFAALARAGSDQASGETGGDLGWAADAQIVPEIRTQIAGMAVGEISDPIRTQAGFHIIRLVDTKPAGVRPLPEIRDQLIAALRQNKLQAGEQAYVSALLEKNPAMINELALRKIFETP